MKVLHYGIAIVLACAIMACRADRIDAPLTVAELCARQDSLMRAIVGGTIDDDFEVLARLVPGGFGGVTISYVFLKQPALQDTMRATVRNLETCAGAHVPYLDVVAFAPVRQGDFDWIQLRTWYRVLIERVPGMWHQADMDESRNRLSFAFVSSSDLEAFRVKAIAAGVPEEALYLFVAPMARATQTLM